MKDDRAPLVHILQALSRIESYASAGAETFNQDTKTQGAIIRNLEVIGEAVKGFSDDIKARHPEIPWKQIAGMRDFLIHVYFGVSLERVWETVQTDLAPLRKAIESELG